MITSTPTEYELYDDEAQQLLATIKAFDADCSNVEITTVVDAGSWGPLALAISNALLVMHPKKEEV